MQNVNTRIIRFLDTDNKTVVSAYRLFQRPDGKNLVFYPVPKNANSSFKKLFVELLSIEKDYLFLDDDIPMHQKKLYQLNSNKNSWLWSFLPPKPRFTIMPSSLNAIKIAVIRDPIERFLSAYNNRLKWHKDIDFYNLSIKDVIKKLKENSFDNQHFLPQTFFLGNNPNYFNYISKMPSIDGLVDYINQFFGKNLKIKKLQTNHGENPMTLEEVSKFSNDLKYIYKKDYEFINSIEGNLI
ncbi:sulfotransferase family protein [Alphaproteobacteria bacterium]|nr:sulfotransferase family protein [Alphaproteobacteria bacterium]